jgi:hypothetical protein
MDLDQMVTDANKRITKVINKLVKEAKADTTRDFAAAAKRLGLTDDEWAEARKTY